MPIEVAVAVATAAAIAIAEAIAEALAIAAVKPTVTSHVAHCYSELFCNTWQIKHCIFMCFLDAAQNGNQPPSLIKSLAFVF